jgi:glutamate:GABA antiporter
MANEAAPERPSTLTDVRRAEERVEERSAVFTKELGLTDLVLTQIVFVVGTIWVGTAAKLGNDQLFFWLLAIATFYVPLAVVVIQLNRLMPLEGGLYQWSKLAFNDFVGFMVAWDLWVFAIFVMSGIGLTVVTNLSYALGPGAHWMAGSKGFITVFSVALVAILVLVSTRGLSVGKWIHNAGGVLLSLTFLALIALPFVSVWRGTLDSFHPFVFAIPTLSQPQLFTQSVNIFTKLALGALTGFEYVAILAGESKTPARNIGRSVIIAAPIIALMFILGTASVLAFVRPDEVDLIGPIAQVLSRGFGRFGVMAANVVSLVILALIGRLVALMSIYLTANARLPMVAGWDGLLPAWFTRLHPRFHTPVNSIVVVGSCALVLGLLGMTGVGMQEAFQLLDNAAGIFYATTYIVLFAIPLFAARRIGLRAPFWLRAASASGAIVSLVYIGFTIVPIVQVKDRFAFAAKLVGVALALNIVGAALYVAGRRPQKAATFLIAMVVTALVGGCGAELGGGGGIFDRPASARFTGWASLSPTGCTGALENAGGKTASGVRVHVYYTTASGESLVVVTPAMDRLTPNATTTFVAPPQVTRGELRYPRCGGVAWSDGSTAAEVYAPYVALFGWCPVAPDSVCCIVVEAAQAPNPAYIYNLTLRLEGREGVVNRAAVPDYLGGGGGYAYFTSTTRDSAGIALPPRALSLTWENYGGVPDSLVIADLLYGGVGFTDCPLVHPLGSPSRESVVTHR